MFFSKCLFYILEFWIVSWPFVNTWWLFNVLYTNIQYIVLQFKCLTSNTFPFWSIKVVLFLLMCILFTYVPWIASLRADIILCLTMLRKLHQTLHLSFNSCWLKKLSLSDRSLIFYYNVFFIYHSNKSMSMELFFIVAKMTIFKICV